MMQTFRNNMKIVFFVIIIFFIGWMGVTLTGLDDFLLQQSRDEIKGLKYAGSIDGESIERTAYDQRLQYTIDMATNQRGGTGLSAWEIDQLAEQVWTEIINERVFSKIYQQHGITVCNPEIVEYIKSNPMPEIARMPEFQTDGRFDYDKYFSLLADPAAAQFVFQLERDAREKIPSFKLFVEIASLSKLTDAELERAYKKMEEKVKVKYIHFDSDSLVSDSEVNVEESEIKEYYDTHKDEFQRPDMIDLSYILLPVVPSTADTMATLDTLKMILKKLEEGENWDSLAMQYSQGPLASSGGNLGWFAKGDYTDKKMVELAFSLKAGKTSEPTVTAAGYQIVRVDSVRTKDGKPQVKAHRILRRIVAGRKTTNQVRSRARVLRKLMQGDDVSFSKVAADSGFSVTRTDLFAIGGQIPGLETNRELLDYIYGAKVGNISYPIDIYPQGERINKSVLLTVVEDRKEKGFIPFDETSSMVKRQLAGEKKKAVAREEIIRLMTDYESFESLEKFAEIKALSLEASNEFSRLTGLPAIGRNNAFVGTAFGLPVGAKSNLIEVGNDFYLLEVVSRSEADSEKFEENRERLAQQLRSSMMQAIYSLFTQELINNTKIEDYRRIASPDDTLSQAMLP